MASAEKRVSIKKAAARLVRELPESATWDDLMAQIIARQKIEASLSDLREGRDGNQAARHSKPPAMSTNLARLLLLLICRDSIGGPTEMLQG